MNKSTGTLITALLILLLAGSAMCATYDDYVDLIEKDADWNVVDDGANATVQFNTSGEKFGFSIEATGLDGNECYYLIYYADRPDRFNEEQWGGDNPGAFIADFSTTPCGEIGYTEDSAEINMNLPHKNDWNIDPDPDYCNGNNGFDYYDNCCGAKLWLITCDDYEDGRVINWQNHENWLFETDLIWYDDTGENETPVIDDVWTEECIHNAGDIVNITALVCDQDGVGDLENMVVTVNFSEYGVEELVVLKWNQTLDCTCAEYTGNITMTVAQGDMCGEVVATDPSGEYDEAEVCFDVAPGPCAQLVIEGPDKALTRKSFCQGFDDENYAVYLDVTCEDGYGNPTDDCDCDMEVTGTGSASVLWHQNDECGWVIRVSDFDQPETVTITAHCVCDPDVESGTHDITFLNPVENLSVTSDPGVLYEMNDCSEDRDCVNISAELTDISGEPIPMPDVPVDFIVNGCWYDGADTDENGTATIELCMRWEYDDSIDVLAVAICREGTMTIDIVEPELYRVEIINEDGSPVDGEMVCTEEQDLNYTCWTDRGTEMCCPECTPTWSCDALGDVNDTGYFTALDSGTCVVMVNVSGEIGTGEIVIDCPENCTEVEAGVPFVVTSGSVSLSGNFTEDCDAVCVQAFGDPIPEFDNDTRGAEVETCELATIDLNGTGAIWMKNETTGNWSKYAYGDTAYVLNGTYALVDDPTPACANVVITTEDPVDIVVGDTVTFTASCTDQFGDPFTCADLTWNSDNETVGTMGSPTLTALAPGVTNVTATGCGDSNSIQVNVSVAPVCANVTITTGDPVDIEVGDTVTFTASCTDQFGDPFTCTELTWTSDNVTVGTMGSPTLTALALGVTNITATGCGDSNSIQVNVTGGDDPIDRYDANGNGYIDRDELKTAIYDYLEEPIGTVISRDDLKTLIYDYLDNLP